MTKISRSEHCKMELCVNEGQKLSECRVSPTKERRNLEGEKSVFNYIVCMSNFVERWPFGKVTIHIGCISHKDNVDEA